MIRRRMHVSLIAAGLLAAAAPAAMAQPIYDDYDDYGDHYDSGYDLGGPVAPVISDFGPRVVTPGQEVTIRADQFAAGTRILLDGREMPVLRSGPGFIAFTAPSGIAGGQLTLAVPGMAEHCHVGALQVGEAAVAPASGWYGDSGYRYTGSRGYQSPVQREQRIHEWRMRDMRQRLRAARLRGQLGMAQRVRLAIRHELRRHQLAMNQIMRRERGYGHGYGYGYDVF